MVFAKINVAFFVTIKLRREVRSVRISMRMIHYRTQPTTYVFHEKTLPNYCGFIPLIASAQTLTDGLMMPKKDLCTGFIYTHDKWDEYWEGELKRENENIGAVTTQTLMWMGTHGITDKINVIAMLPYVKTEASQGTLSGMEGVQDLSTECEI